MYIVLGVLYESFIHPLTILSTLPSAGDRRAASLLWVTGHDLDIIGIIGIVLLIGIVKKNAIMMVDFALEAEREDGKPPREAIYQASLLRFRPILMTTMAALLGAVPLMLGTGTGSELRRPLGLAIVGGLIVSQVLTLFTTPVDLPRCSTGSRSGSAAASRSRCAPAMPAPARRVNLSAPVHPPPGRDHAAGDRDRARRRARLLPLAGLAAAAGRLPDHQRAGEPARRRRRRPSRPAWPARSNAISARSPT